MFGLTRRFPALKLHSVARRAIYLSLTFLVFATIIIPIYFLYREDFRNTIANYETSPDPGIDVPHMILDCLIVNVDTGNGTYRMIVSYSTNKLDTNNRLNSNVSVWVRGVRKDFARNDRLGSSDLTFSFKESKPRAYPFDAHTGEFDVSGLYLVNGIQSDLAFRIGLDIAVPGFKLRKEYISTNPSFVVTKFSIIRSNITIGFSLFIGMLNWLLSLIMAFLAIQILIKKRPVPPPLIVPGLALLFALPQLRSVQPGVPPIPATSDVVGFFWNMFIVAVSAMIIILCFILRYKSPTST